MYHKENEEPVSDEDGEMWSEVLSTGNDFARDLGLNISETYEFINENVDDLATSPDHCDKENDHLLSSPQGNPVDRMTLNDHKAGMKDLDKERINKIIHEASKGSKFYENEKRKEKKVMMRIEAMKKDLKAFTINDRKKAMIDSNQVLKELSNKLDLSRTLVHIDMDAFYAAVEMRDNPELRDIPMAVGGLSMLSTSNYAARRYGVRAAMPGFIAKKLCPDLVIVSSHFDKYREVSNKIREIFKEYDPNFSPLSLDEAYLDLTDYLNENFMKYDYENKDKDLIEIIVEEIRRKIVETTQLTASAGIAPNLMLSKICSDINKPNGQYYLKADKSVIRNFVKDLPIREISGIGRVSEQMFTALNIKSCQDLIKNRATLYLLFSEASFRYFMNVAMGISSNRIVQSERKSMSAERTFQNISDTGQLLEICRRICENLAEDLTSEHLEGCTVTMKYKFSSFITKTRAKTLPHPISRSNEIYEVSKGLLLKEIANCRPNKFELRLMGVRVSSILSKGSRKQQSVDSFFVGKQNSENERSTDTIYSSKDNETESSTHTTHPSKDNPSYTAEDFAFHEIKLNQISDKNNVEDSVSMEFGSSDPNMVECPVCGELQRNDDVTLNMHVDECLTKKTIKEIMKEQELARCTEMQTYVDKSFENHEGKKKISTDDIANTPRKRKSQQSAGNSKKATLHSFWKKQ